MRLLSEYSIEDPEMKVSIVYPGRQYLPAKTRFFIDYALKKLTQEVNAVVSKPDEVYRQSAAPPATYYNSATATVGAASATAH